MKKNNLKININLIVQALFFLNAGLWILIEILMILRLGNTQFNYYFIQWIIPILIIGDIAVLIFFGIYINKEIKLIYILSLIVLVINAILSITDDIGLLDIITLILNLSTISLLIIFRKSFIT